MLDALCTLKKNAYEEPEVDYSAYKFLCELSDITQHYTSQHVKGLDLNG